MEEVEWEKMDFKERESFLYHYFLNLIKKKSIQKFAILNAILLKKALSKIISKKKEIKWPNDLLLNKRKVLWDLARSY